LVWLEPSFASGLAIRTGRYVLETNRTLDRDRILEIAPP
jgi:hypothetical protein